MLQFRKDMLTAAIATAIYLKPSEINACLKNVTYDKEEGVKQISWLLDVLQFQSTLAYLKDPPPAYPLPPVDIIGGVNNISALVGNGTYLNEYDIEVSGVKNLKSRPVDPDFTCMLTFHHLLNSIFSNVFADLFCWDR